MDTDIRNARNVATWTVFMAMTYPAMGVLCNAKPTMRK